MKRLTAIAIPAFLAVLMMKPVAAADFTITVPIHIQNLEEHIQNLTAHCRVYGANSRGGDDSLARDAHALAVDPNTGNVDADVVFNLTVDPQYGDPRDAAMYRCYLTAETNFYEGAKEIQDCSATLQAHAPPRNTVKTITVADRSQPCRVTLEGSLTDQ